MTATNTASIRLALLLCAAAASVIIGHAAAGMTRELVGYEEGSRRAVTCKGGGYFTGLEVAFGPMAGFAEDVALALRLRCSTGVLELQYAGEVPDTYAFGAAFDSGSRLSATCPPGRGIAALRWRRADVAGREAQAWKVGGLQVYCGTETATPIIVDPGRGKAYAFDEPRCSATARPPEVAAGGGEVHAVEVEAWTEVDWAGLRLVRCGALGAPPSR